MKKEKKIIIKRKSLRQQYILAASIVSLLLILASTITGIYLSYVTSSTTESLNQYDKIVLKVDELDTAIRKADKSIAALISSPEKIYHKRIVDTIHDVRIKIDNLLELEQLDNNYLLPQIKKIEFIHHQLHVEVTKLLELRNDINWLYPMLPYINITLLESNSEFETAINIAIKETLNIGNKQSYGNVFRLLDELRNIWRLKILDFRGALIRFAGLSAINIAQEDNIKNFQVNIENKLKKLLVLKNKGQLGFETEDAIETMILSSGKWYKDYQELLLIRKSNVWRADIKYIKNNIQPLQENIFNELVGLDKSLRDISLNNTIKIKKVTKQIHLELWVLTIIAVMFVVLIYRVLEKSLLIPVAHISELLTDENQNLKNIELPEKGSKEVHSLIDSFNTMRRQIHHRQMALEFQAMHDSLTGLPNRALFQDRLEQAINLAERDKSCVSILLLDLDRFKDINDTLGHSIGDRVLRRIAKRLEKSLRSSDTVARLGGDEFSILTSYNNRSQIEAFVDRIVKDIERVIIIDDQKLYVGVSVGIASYPSDGKDPDTLIRHADIAMYSAKRENKNQEFYAEEKDYHNADNLTLLAELKAELKKPSDQIQLYFQPQIDLNTSEVTSVEALIRWNHPVQGFIPAEQIIRVAEQTGLISELTYWVIAESIKEYIKWDNLDITISINLSVWNLQDPNLISFISKKLNENNIKPEKIVFEITESDVMHDPIKAREVLTTLSEMGVELAVDDYGTGFSSLAYLKVLPVKCLKIDKSFVIDMFDDENDAIIVHSTIELAHNLGLTVVAEGVETEQLLDKLRQLGCDYAQGYLISKPKNSSEFIKWMNNYNLKN